MTETKLHASVFILFYFLLSSVVREMDCGLEKKLDKKILDHEVGKIWNKLMLIKTIIYIRQCVWIPHLIVPTFITFIVNAI